MSTSIFDKWESIVLKKINDRISKLSQIGPHAVSIEDPYLP